jgi:hypothetical protein
MSAHAASYITGFFLAFVTLVALLLVIPEASAASKRLKKTWQAWVWPLTFLGLLVKSVTEAIALLQKQESSSFLWQLGDLAACFALTVLVLNSVYRALDDTGAHRITLVAWILYFLFALAIFALSTVPVLLIFEVLSAVGLTVFYARLYFQQRERAPDAPPVIIAITLLLFSALLYIFPFNLDLRVIEFNQIVLAHLLQIVATFFLYRGANLSYTVKYVAHRREERKRPSSTIG